MLLAAEPFETNGFFQLRHFLILLDTDRARFSAPLFDIRATTPFYLIKNRRSLYARTLGHIGSYNRSELSSRI